MCSLTEAIKEFKPYNSTIAKAKMLYNIYLMFADEYGNDDPETILAENKYKFYHNGWMDCYEFLTRFNNIKIKIMEQERKEKLEKFFTDKKESVDLAREIIKNVVDLADLYIEENLDYCIPEMKSEIRASFVAGFWLGTTSASKKI